MGGNDRTITKRTQAHAARMDELGLKRASIWIPKGDDAAASIKASAKRLRKKHGCPLPND